MQASDKQSFLIPYYMIRDDAQILSSLQNYVNDFNLTTKEFQKFYETYETYFELIAQLISSKL